VRHNHLQPTWVWRKRGSGSPESLCKFASFAPVRAAVEAPPAQSPGALGASGGQHGGKWLRNQEVSSERPDLNIN